MKVILDTGVLVAMYVEHEFNLEARSLSRAPYTFRVTPFCRAEFMSVLQKYLRAGELEMDDAKKAYRHALRTFGQKESVPPGPETLEAAMAFNVSAYDAMLLGLQHRMRNVPVVSTDGRFVKAVTTKEPEAKVYELRKFIDEYDVPLLKS